jgi:hypothetical protein
MTAGTDLITAERQRQIEVEGWDAQHDADHSDELALAGACYALTREERDTETYIRHRTRTILSELWPWQDKWWKPVTPADGSPKSFAEARVRELVKAGALIAAAIDDLIRESQP